MHTNRIAALILASLLVSSPAAGGPPGWSGGSEKGKKQLKNVYFVEQQRVVVREYYIEEHRRGKCPPGLAKKRNGCMPPGHAKKKWQVGQPLPREVVYYEVPSAVVVKLGEPPPGHRYVRVAADILLIAVGTAMVVGAIEDLGRM